MSTPNKYHSSGREYTATELAERRRALTPVYLVLGYSANPLVQAQQRIGKQCQPYDKDRNTAKQVVRGRGFKSLKQYNRWLERSR